MSTPWIDTINGVDICHTNFNHPDITTGQHTNGPPSVWVRVHPDGEWYPTRSYYWHKVWQWVEAFGVEYVDLCRQEGWE